MYGTGTHKILLLLSAIVFACSFGCRPGSDAVTVPVAARIPAPVEVAHIERGSIRAIRTFSGALEASASFLVAPKVGGRIESIAVDLGDAVNRGAIVAVLDVEEYEQAQAQVEADLLVEEANQAQSERALEIAKRAMERAETLSQRGVASDVEVDSARSELLAKEAGVEVYRARVNRAKSSVESARIRENYTKVTASWNGEGATRYVAERFIDEGETVAANTPILRIVDMNPLSGVFFVTEKDYAALHVGQKVEIRTDAYFNEVFTATISRIAPVFQAGSRQARVELSVPNGEQRLKPGMFIRASVEVGRVGDAVVVPEAALVTRDDSEGVFIVDSVTRTVAWQTVEVGIREGEHVQIIGENLEGMVVTLGQQLIKEGASVDIVEKKSEPDRLDTSR